MQEENNKQNQMINEYDEISLKELILNIWSERILIILITIAVFAAAVLYTFVLASPTYKAETELLIKQPTSVGTRYGTYAFPTGNINDYIQYINSNAVVDRVVIKNDLDKIGENGMSNQSFRDKVNISNDEESNRFKISFEYNDPDLTYQVNKSLIDTYMSTIRMKYKENAVDQFIYDYEVQIDNLQNSIEREETIMDDTKELLDSITPIYTLQKLLFSDPEAAAAYAEEFNLNISDISENVMTQEYVNNNYFSIESKYLDTKTNLISMRESLERKQRFYDELVEERELINQYKNTEEEEKILNGKMDVMRDNIIIVSEAYYSDVPVSPNKLLNLAIGLVLGVMLGVFIGLFKAYWKNS
ncbi:MAG: Wzz/FepE/Etk N-terminal domain-containing protein [Eubacteriales bacterium]